jgi:transposase
MSEPLYLFPEFFRDKPVERLLGYGIKAEEINDDKIGRVMDDIYEVSVDKLWTEIGLNVLKQYEIETKYSHLDSTSMSVEGEYNKSESEENLVNITYGYSKDKRRDLKQFMLELMVSNDGDIPLFLQVENGNESDKKAFTKLIKKYQKNIDLETIYVADSALYTAANLAEMKRENLRWLTRVPFNVKKAGERLTNISEHQWKQAEEKSYQYIEIIENYHGIEQRWLMVESEKRRESDREKLAKNINSELEKIEKQIQKLLSKEKKENKEKEKKIRLLSKKWKYYELIEVKYVKEEEKYEVKYQENQSIIELERKKCGRFIIATNVMDEQELSSEEMLKQYKNQQSCERGFRFLKDPLLLTKSVYVKSPKRVEVMAILMGLCLLVYNIGQRMIRQELRKRGEKIRNQVKKWIENPTLRWIFQLFQGIHLVKMEGREMVSNLREEIRKILGYFSENCQKYYGY